MKTNFSPKNNPRVIIIQKLYGKFFDDEEQFMSKAAKTPRSNCVLDTTKAEKAGIGMRPVEEAMRESMQKMVKVAAV